MNTNTDQRLLLALRNELLLAGSRADAYALALEVAGKDSAETWSQVVALSALADTLHGAVCALREELAVLRGARQAALAAKAQWNATLAVTASGAVVTKAQAEATIARDAAYKAQAEATAAWRRYEILAAVST